MIKRLSLLFLFSLLGLTGYSQTLTSFSEDQSDFLKELDDLMNYNKQPKLKETHDRFKSMVKDGQFSAEELSSVRNVADLMLKAKLIANPHFDGYLKGIMSVKNLEAGQIDLLTWNDFLTKIFNSGIKLKRDNYKNIINFGAEFFNEKILYRKTSSFYWSAYTDIPLNLGVEENLIYVELKDVDLVCVRSKDSLIINNTSGRYNILSKKFAAQGGFVNWSRFDTEEEISAQLSDFEVEMTKGLYKCSKVELSYPRYFGSQKITGRFEDKIGSKQKGNKGSYPKFESHLSLFVQGRKLTIRPYPNPHPASACSQFHQTVWQLVAEQVWRSWLIGCFSFCLQRAPKARAPVRSAQMNGACRVPCNQAA